MCMAHSNHRISNEKSGEPCSFTAYSLNLAQKSRGKPPRQPQLLQQKGMCLDMHQE